MPNKLLGQNFLNNPQILERLVSAVDARAGDTILEVGPGHGALTLPLAVACAAANANLVAVEKDHALAEAVKDRLDKTEESNVRVVAGDILELIDSYLTVHGSTLKVIGNIPYYLTGHLLRLISESETAPARCVFMVQKEVALRIAAAPPDMNRLAASVQYWAVPKILMMVSRKEFTPVPKVDSAVVVLEKRESSASPDAVRYFAAMRALFTQPRKTIFNNLAVDPSIFEAAAGLSRKEFLAKQLQELGIDPGDRPQALSVRQISDIAEKFLA